MQLIASLAILAFSAAVAVAAPQTTDQQKCLNDVTKAGANVVKTQGKANWKCLRYANQGKTEKLGDAGETLNAQACLTNDVGGKVDKKQQKTIVKDGQRCLDAPASMPDFAYTGAVAVNDAGKGEAIELVAAIFGPDLDAAVVDDEVDSDGARCQQEILKGANRITDDGWKVVRLGLKDGLKGKKRRAGVSPDDPIFSLDNMQGEALAQTFDDVKSKIQGEVDKLGAKAQQRCPAALTSIASMFPGDCSASADVGALVDCVAGLAKAHLFQSVAGFYGMSVACDLTDDGLHNESCVTADQEMHVLDRVAYGPDPGTISSIQTLGLSGFIDAQLDPGMTRRRYVDTALAANYASLDLNFNELRTCYPQGGGGTCPGIPDGNKNDVWRELHESEAYRAVASARQLEAVLVDFWFNHYNVNSTTGRRKWDATPYVRESIRPWILGNFEESVVRMTRGPAMLDYLDQRQNQIGSPPGTGYNENFSRELLELHTLSVDGPYTELDVKEAARALTGWREDYDNDGPGFEYNGFEYRDSWHDYLGAKTVLGVTIDIPGDGEMEGFEVIRLASEHPSTASFVCTKLIRRFVGEAVPFALVEECAAVFLANSAEDDQLELVLRTIFESPEFLLFPQYRKAKVKRPFVFGASLVRALGVDPDPGVFDYNDLRKTIRDLGEELRDAGPPTGYPDVLDRVGESRCADPALQRDRGSDGECRFDLGCVRSRDLDRDHRRLDAGVVPGCGNLERRPGRQRSDISTRSPARVMRRRSSRGPPSYCPAPSSSITRGLAESWTSAANHHPSSAVDQRSSAFFLVTLRRNLVNLQTEGM